MLLLMDSQSSDSLLLKVLATLNEAQARWYVAREALARAGAEAERRGAPAG